MHKCNNRGSDGGDGGGGAVGEANFQLVVFTSDWMRYIDA